MGGGRPPKREQMDDGPYRRFGSREIYRNPWVAIQIHEIAHPTGEPGEHVVVAVPPASAVLVEDARGGLVFASQPRFAAGRECIEIVKGGRDGVESALECARRELREELGLRAAAWVSLGTLYEIPSIVAPAVSLFLAADLEETDRAPEPVERIARVRMERSEAFASAASGEIDDAVTIAALFRYSAVRGFALNR